jgi:hypothetical protein
VTAFWINGELETAAWALLRRSVIRYDLSAIARVAPRKLLSGTTATVVYHFRD